MSSLETRQASVERGERGERGNVDPGTVASFGAEWTKFDQTALADSERQAIFDAYFEVFPWKSLPDNAAGFDLGCGSGRWAACVAPRVGTLHCIDASADALAVTRKKLESAGNCEFHHAPVDSIPLPDDSMDFGYSLGVLHHVPDTQAGISSCVAKLKPGAPFLLYLYYAFDNRPAWFRAIWRVTDIGRRVVARLPQAAKYPISYATAAAVYFPLARLSRALEMAGVDVDTIPLSAYRNRSFYTMCTDSLDRFTPLEQRFTAKEMRAMMERAGLENITFSDKVYWCAVGYKRA